VVGETDVAEKEDNAQNECDQESSNGVDFGNYFLSIFKR
jgi:hypothetical protein